jgi:PAS domain S-box-containing protein
VVDITDRKRAEEQLRRSEEQWRNVFENNPTMYFMVNAAGTVLSVNPFGAEQLGYTVDELVGHSVLDVFYEADREAVQANVGLCLEQLGRPRSWELRKVRKDGTVIWCRETARAVPRARNHPIVLIVCEDISQRKQAEAALRRSEASLTEAQQISHTGSWRWNFGTGEVSCSAEHLRIFALDPATTPPSYATFMERVHAEDRTSFEQALDLAVRERSRFHHEYRITLPDGTVKHLQSVGQPDITESGDLEFVGTVMDITERRRAEEALRNVQAELARVARLTMMGELVASIAHEINQPLAAVMINGDAGLLWLNHDKPDLDQARDALSRIVRDAHRAGNVIRGLRALATKSEPHPIKLDINGAIQEVLALIRGDLQLHGVVLRTNLSADVRPVFGDRVQLQQVLLNLITNGIDAMRAVTERPKLLTITSEPVEPGGVLVAVADTGTGLDPASADRIFDSFFTTKPDGMGIGLAISRSIIEAHEGRLWAMPNAPRGAAFKFTLPQSAGKRVDNGA